MRDSFAKCFRDYSTLCKWRHWKAFRRNCRQVRLWRKEEAEAKIMYTRVPLLCFLSHFAVTCDLGGQLLNRHMKTWNLLLLNWYCTTEKCRILAIIIKQQILGKINSTLCFLAYIFNRQINRTQSFCCSIGFNRAYHVNYRTQSRTVRWVRLIWLIVSAS